MYSTDSWVSGSLVHSLTPTEFGDPDGNDSDMLDSILMEQAKHGALKTQVELLRACLAEAELERDAARQQAVPSPPPLSKKHVRPSWPAVFFIGLALALAVGAFADQQRALAEHQAAAEALRSELQVEKDKYIYLLAEQNELAEQTISCRNALEALEEATAKNATVAMSAYGVGPIQVVMSIVEFVAQAGRRFIRPRTMAKISMTSE
jgi:hypothetical protein